MPFKALLLLSMTLALVPHEPPRPAATDAPASAVSLSMPASGLDLSISYRQVGTDLKPFLEGHGLDEAGLHKLRVSALLAQGGMLVSDMELMVGDTRLPPGRYALGFTVGSGEAMDFFLVRGNDVIPLGSDALDPGWTSDRLLLQLVFVARNETHLVWHVGPRAGRIVLHPGGLPRGKSAADEPPPTPAGDTPRR